MMNIVPEYVVGCRWLKASLKRRKLACAAIALMALLSAAGAMDAATIRPEFASFYNLTAIGAPPIGVSPAGGAVFKNGDPSRLLVGASPGRPDAQIYEVEVVRDALGRITGFNGTGTFFAHASGLGGGGIDSGLAYAPDGTLLFTSYPDNTLGQIKPGSTAPDKLLDLTALDIGDSVGTIHIIPAGFANAGQAVITSFTKNKWYRANLAPDGNGTYDLSQPLTEITFGGGGLEGIFYVPAGAPGFSQPAVLVSELSNARIVAFEIDGNSDPVLASKRVLLDNLPGVLGMTQDPITGDLLVSTWGSGDQIHRLSGFAGPGNPLENDVPLHAPEPATFAITAVGLLLAGCARARFRKGA